MLDFIKGFFYLSISVVFIATYLSISSHFQNIEKQKIERRMHLDEYYSKEFRRAYRFMNPDFLGGNFVKSGSEDFENAKINADYDGYDRADVEIMISKAFSDVIEEIRISKEFERNENQKKLGEGDKGYSFVDDFEVDED